MDWDIRNYYEFLVRQAIGDRKLDKQLSHDELLDLVCITLNQLPCRYYRHHIDFASHIDTQERQKLDIQVATALDNALQFLQSDRRLQRAE